MIAPYSQAGPRSRRRVTGRARRSPWSSTVQRAQGAEDRARPSPERGRTVPPGNWDARTACAIPTVLPALGLVLVCASWFAPSALVGDDVAERQAVRHERS